MQIEFVFVKVSTLWQICGKIGLGMKVSELWQILGKIGIGKLRARAPNSEEIF